MGLFAARVNAHRHALLTGVCAAKHRAIRAMSTSYKFGPWPIGSEEVFYTSPLSFAFVNLKPVVPGHVLVSSKRVVPRFADLTHEEVSDLWLTAQHVGSKMQAHYKSTSLTLTIQDGPEAGQTVPHVHVHVLPRRQGDFEPNDKVYDAIDAQEAASGAAYEKNLDAERAPRTREAMAEEASVLRGLFA